MILAAHQPDLLPYSGFWYKMAKADLFDLAVFDQFQSRGYQRRVMMRGDWCSVPVLSGASMRPIMEAMVDPPSYRKVLKATVYGRYRTAPFWSERSDQVQELIASVHSEWLWQANLTLILGMRDLLGIRTPIAVGMKPEGARSDGLVDLCRQYGATTYLSGTGGMAYMELEPFVDAGIDLKWSEHDPLTGDSILSVLFDCSDPLAVVMREKQ